MYAVLFKPTTVPWERRLVSSVQIRRLRHPATGCLAQDQIVNKQSDPRGNPHMTFKLLPAMWKPIQKLVPETFQK